MRIVNVRKFVRSIIIVLGVIGMLSLLLMNSTLSYKELEYETIYISQGDTFWNLAQELQETNNYYKGKDVRYIIDDLININTLDSKTLTVNQKLQVPN